MPIRKEEYTYIKEYDVSVRVSIMTINAIESLRKLHIANFLPRCRIHHETHSFSECLAVVDVVIAVDIQQVRGIGDDGRDPNLCHLNISTKRKTIIHGIILLMAFKTESFVKRIVLNKTSQQ